MRRIILTTLLAVTAALMTARDDPAPGVRRVGVTEIANTLTHGNPVLLDIRTPAEVAQARLAETVRNIDFYAEHFAQDIAALDRNDTYVLYCRSGQRTSHAAKLMHDLGFTDVQELAGGLISWVDAGEPLHS